MSRDVDLRGRYDARVPHQQIFSAEPRQDALQHQLLLQLEALGIGKVLAGGGHLRLSAHQLDRGNGSLIHFHLVVVIQPLHQGQRLLFYLHIFL